MCAGRSGCETGFRGREGSLSYGDKMCGVLYHFLDMFIIELWGEKIEHFREEGKKALLDPHLEMTLL